MINENFVFIGALFGIYGTGSYAISTLRGKTKPNRVTWFLWAVIPAIIIAAQIQKGVGLQIVMTFVVGLGPLLVFIASFLNKKASWKITRFDIVCGSVAVIAIILWRLTGDGDLAIALSIAADFFAGVPTLIKAFKHPETEHSTGFRNGIINAGITLLTVKVWQFSVYGIALYTFLICIVLYTLVRFRLGKILAR